MFRSILVALIVLSFGLVSVSAFGGPTLTVLSPNNGESWAFGSPHQISWSDPTFDPNDLLNNLYTVNVVRQDGSLCGEIDMNTHRLDYNWNVGVLDNGTKLLSGTDYYIQVLKQGTLLSDNSDTSFTITAAIVPTIKVLTPTGGSRYVTGDRVLITWEGAGAETYPIGLYLEAKDEFGGDYIYQTIAMDIPSWLGAVSWQIPPYIESGSYLMRAVVNPEAGPQLADFTTSSFFTIQQVVPEPASLSVICLTSLFLFRRAKRS